MAAESSRCDKEIDEFIIPLKHGNYRNSYELAIKTINLLRLIIGRCEWDTASDLIAVIRKEGKKLIMADPTETVVGNMVRRVLKIVREEHTSGRTGGDALEEDTQESLQKLFLARGHSEDYKIPVLSLKDAVLESLGEYIRELEDSMDNLAVQALEHIHASEVILTIGRSRTVEKFLKEAAKKRKFQLIVAEGAPFFHGHELSVNMAKMNVETTVITDSAIFAMMARVNKVIIGTHTIMANGGLKAISGTHTIALAAKHFSVPLIVCAGMFKLSPQFVGPHNQDVYNKFVSPQDVLKFSEGELLSKISIQNPVFEYVPPELVTLLISNIGGNAPSYVYRLLSELYHPDDYDL